MFYEFDQNNSGGVFTVNDDVCHRLFIEADSLTEAISKAEDLGCYWDGVAHGIDCPCCGDRWYPSAEEVNIEEYKTNGYPVYVYDDIYSDTAAEWNRRYGKFRVMELPKFKTSHCSKRYEGSICFSNIEEYVQYLADEYGWTTPDARIYYKDGKVTSIYSVDKSCCTEDSRT